MALSKKLLIMKAELLIERKKLEKFREEVVVSNIIHAISEALKVLDKRKRGVPSPIQKAS